MPVFSNILAGAAGQSGGDAAAYTIERSIRLNAGDNPNLDRTPSTQGNRRKWTWSAWVKLTADSDTYNPFFSAGNNPWTGIHILDGTLRVVLDAGVGEIGAITTAKLRDYTGWYSIIVSVDTTISSPSSDRIKIWVNGVRQATSAGSSGYPGQNYETIMNTTIAHRLGADGRVSGGGVRSSNSLMADVHFLDGTAITDPDGVFGQYSSTTGAWDPIQYTGSYDVTGGTTVAAASGAEPILNTSDAYGKTVGSGVRSDSNSSYIVLALPLNGSNGGTTITDYHHTIKGSGSAKTVSIYTGSASGGAVTSTAQSVYYGSSFYAVRGATNNYTASDYIYRTGDNDLAFGTGSFCVEFWYRPGTFVQNSTMFDSRHDSTDWPNATHGFQFYTNHNGDLILRTGSSNIIHVGQGQLTEGEWSHLAVTGDYSGSNRTIRIFRDGTQVGSATSNNDFSEGRFHLGSAANNGEGSNGYYADLRIYKGVAKYTSNFTVPDKPDGGVNSFRLDFADNTSSSNLGLDRSGTGNNWTVNNISVATGYGNDSLLDSPTNYDDGTNIGGNYATLNQLMADSQGTLSNGSLVLNGQPGFHGFSTIGFSSGKWYAEVTGIAGGGSSDYLAGIADLTQLNGNSVFDAFSRGFGYRNDAKKINNNSAGNYGATYTINDVIGVAADLDNGTITFYKNGTSQGTAYTTIPSGHTYHFAHFCRTSSDSVAWNFGQQPWVYPPGGTGGPPATYKALCTQNFDDPAILKGSDYFKVSVWDGDGANSRTITTGYEPDLVWVKNRTTTGRSHYWYDAVRGFGANKELVSNSTVEEGSNNHLTQNHGYVSGTTSTGFTLAAGATNSTYTNDSGATYCAWTWDVGTTNTTVGAGDLNSSAYDQSQNWSNLLSASGGSGFTNQGNGAFTGYDTNQDYTYVTGAGSGTNYTITLTPPSAISYTSSVVVRVEPTHGEASIDGGTTWVAESPANSGLVTFYGPGSFTSITVRDNRGQYSGEFHSVRIDGKLLVNSGVTPPNVPNLACTYRANPTSGVSIITYTGNQQSGANVAHGLATAPAFYTSKCRSHGSMWMTRHKDVANTHYMQLNDGAQALNAVSDVTGDADPTAFVIPIGAADANNNGRTQVMYAFSPVEGFSAMGVYKANGSGNGPYQWCGFRPRWILLKSSTDTTARNWYIYDTVRDIDGNETDTIMHANTDSVEGPTSNDLDILSNGFKITGTGTSSNYGSNYYIWMAFAELPFKYSRAY